MASACEVTACDPEIGNTSFTSLVLANTVISAASRQRFSYHWRLRLRTRYKYCMFTACGQRWHHVVPVPQVLHPECVLVFLKRMLHDVVGKLRSHWGYWVLDGRICKCTICSCHFLRVTLLRSVRLRGGGSAHPAAGATAWSWFMIHLFLLALGNSCAALWNPQHLSGWGAGPVQLAVACEAGGARLLGVRPLKSAAWWRDLQVVNICEN